LDGCKGEIEFPTFAAGAREIKLCEIIVDSAKSEGWKKV